MRNLTVALLVAAAAFVGIALYGDLNPAAWRVGKALLFRRGIRYVELARR